MKAYASISLLFLFFFSSFAQRLTRQQLLNVETLMEIIDQTHYDHSKVIFLADKVLKIDSANSRVIAYRAFAYEGKKDYTAALKDFELFTQKRPTSAFCLYRGRLKATMGDTAGAFNDALLAITLSGYDEAISDQLYMFYRKLGHIQRVTKIYENIAKLHPNNYPAYAVIGMQKEKEGNIKLAQKNYTALIKAINNQLLKGRIEYRPAYYLEAECDFKLKNYKDAIKNISETILLYPEDPFYYKERINYYSVTGDKQRACEDMMQLQLLDKDYIPQLKVKCTLSKEDTLRLDKWYARVDAEKYYIKGYRENNGDSVSLQKSIQLLSKALEYDPDHQFSLARRGLKFIFIHQNENAIKDFDRVLQLNPKSSEAYHFRAFAKRGLEKNKEAINDESQAIRHDSTNVEYWISRAALESDIGDTTNAIADLSVAIRLKPNSDKAYYEKGVLELFYKKDYKTALALLQKAVELQEDEPLSKKHALYHYYSALAFDKLSQYENALYEIDKAISITPRDGSYYYYAGEIKARMKDMTGACEDWNMAKKLNYEKADELILYNCK